MEKCCKSSRFPVWRRGANRGIVTPRRADRECGRGGKAMESGSKPAAPRGRGDALTTSAPHRILRPTHSTLPSSMILRFACLLLLALPFAAPRAEAAGIAGRVVTDTGAFQRAGSPWLKVPAATGNTKYFKPAELSWKLRATSDES